MSAGCPSKHEPCPSSIQTNSPVWQGVSAPFGYFYYYYFATPVSPGSARKGGL